MMQTEMPRRKKIEKPTRNHRRYVLVSVVALIFIATLSGFGWRWVSHLKCERVEISGARLADASALIPLAGVDTSMVMLDIDPVLVADRVTRHPWIAKANVRRIPNGTVSIYVEERVPVAVVLDDEGRPTHYVDAKGAQMPLVKNAVYDVPLLRGLRQSYHPVQRLENPSIRSFLDVLSSAPRELEAIISEIELRPDGDIWLTTMSNGKSGAISVRIGQENFAGRLDRLGAFWRQAVLAHPDRIFKNIDLRFERQIVTRES